MPTITQPQSTAQASAAPKAAARHPLLVAAEAIVLVVLAIFALEWFFGVCAVGQGEFLEPDSKLGVRHIPGKLVTWRLEGFSNEHLSSTGLRDIEHQVTKPAGITRIVLLGNSSTEGMQVPLQDTYSRVLEQELNGNGPKRYEVINFATSSFGTGQEYLQFRNEVLKYKPDITVVLYTRSDSLWNVRDPGNKNAEPRPYFYLDQSGQLHEDDSLVRGLGGNSWQEKTISFLRSHSRIYGVICQTDLALSIHEKLYRKIRGPIRNLFSFGSKPPAISTRPLYRKQDGWAVTAALFKALNETCHANASKLVVMVFPNTLNDPALFQESSSLNKQSIEQSFGYIDLTKPFVRTGDVNSLFLQYHFSSAGHKLTADQLKQYLQSQKLIS